ncbi:MAG: hypothetical protein ACK4LQ_03970 [Pararhodobacter sp.]
MSQTDFDPRTIRTRQLALDTALPARIFVPMQNADCGPQQHEAALRAMAGYAHIRTTRGILSELAAGDAE